MYTGLDRMPAGMVGGGDGVVGGALMEPLRLQKVRIGAVGNGRDGSAAPKNVPQGMCRDVFGGVGWRLRWQPGFEVKGWGWPGGPGMVTAGLGRVKPGWQLQHWTSCACASVAIVICSNEGGEVDGAPKQGNRLSSAPCQHACNTWQQRAPAVSCGAR